MYIQKIQTTTWYTHNHTGRGRRLLAVLIDWVDYWDAARGFGGRSPLTSWRTVLEAQGEQHETSAGGTFVSLSIITWRPLCNLSQQISQLSFAVNSGSLGGALPKTTRPGPASFNTSSGPIPHHPDTGGVWGRRGVLLEWVSGQQEAD